MALVLVITNAGRAAIRNADASGTRAVRIASVGVSAAALSATAATAALPGEVKRITTVSGAAVAADIIHLTVGDETMATYTVRSFALYLDDGTLFAAYGQVDPIIEKSAQALMVLTIDVTLADIAASQITFGDANFLMPPATVDRQGLIELATVAEARAGTDATRAVTPASARSAVRDWIGYTPADRGGDAFTGPVVIRHAGLRCGLTIAQQTTGYGFLQFGEASQVNEPFNWGIGSDGIGGFLLYQGPYGTGAPRLTVTSAAISYNGSAMWHAGNDGAGSGLDADLLDGQDGSWYGNIPARLGYMPLRAGDIADVWRASNDGAGSGLDADLLDGQQGAWYADIPARLGYTPVDRRGDVFTGPVVIRHAGLRCGLTIAQQTTGYGFLQFGEASQVNEPFNWGMGSDGIGGFLLYQGPYGTGAPRLTVTSAAISYNGSAMWHAGNDGAGSGLDADLLDGQDGSWYGNIPARLGYTPLRAGDIADVWRAANDGAGSGLDADMLDGRDGDWYRRWGNLLDVPSAFPPAGHTHGAADLAGAFAGSLAENGYTVLPNGLILQWMPGPMQAARTSAATYMQWPIAFPTACFQAFASTQMQQAGDRGDSWFQLVGAPDQNGATIQRQASGTADDIVASAPRLFAIGH